MDRARAIWRIFEILKIKALTKPRTQPRQNLKSPNLSWRCYNTGRNTKLNTFRSAQDAIELNHIIGLMNQTQTQKQQV